MTNKSKVQFSTLLLYLLILLSSYSCDNPEKGTDEPKSRMNVLFIMADDLRPELGVYGNELVKSPNFDRLAKESILFDRAYCQVPICGASRASILTGLRPTPNRFLNYYSRADRDAPNAYVLPKLFKDNGYKTFSIGKIFHNANDNFNAWSEPPYRLDWGRTPDGSYHDKFDSLGGWRNYLTQTSLQTAIDNDGIGPSFEVGVYAQDTAYADTYYTDLAINKMKQFDEAGENFFMAMGFAKPHLPFNAPKNFWDLYDRDSFELPDREGSSNAPEQALHNWPELRSYADIPEDGPLSEEKARTLIHGYYACVSYIDYELGRLMDYLDESGLAENTVVIFVSDHGWFLGEHNLWCKFANFELGYRVPMMMKIPNGSQGVSPAFVELIDIYPTLSELVNLPAPQNQLQGKSFASFFKDPDNMQSHKPYAIGRCSGGISIKNDTLRYTRWGEENEQIEAQMLFDHRKDPDENFNVVSEEKYNAAINSLGTVLDSQPK